MMSSASPKKRLLMIGILVGCGAALFLAGRIQPPGQSNLSPQEPLPEKESKAPHTDKRLSSADEPLETKVSARRELPPVPGSEARNPFELAAILGSEDRKRLPSGAFETPTIDELKSMHQGLQQSELGALAPETWDTFMVNMKEGLAFAEELASEAAEEEANHLSEKEIVFARGSAEEIALWKQRETQDQARKEILAGLNKRIHERTIAYLQSQTTEDWAAGYLPASLASSNEIELRRALRKGALDHAENRTLVREYLVAERKDAISTLREGDPQDPHWWADRIEWIDRMILVTEN